MCTTVLSVDPGSPVPVLLIGVRDEFLDRPWVGPGRHWPQRPELVGGRDLLAGGTWLAVHSGRPRVACVLNGRGKAAAEDGRLSRGDLPLRMAAGEFGGAHGLGDDSGRTPDLNLDLPRYDPFHLLGATPEAARLWSWDGEHLTGQDLGAGLHIIVNSGLDGEDGLDGQADPPADQLRTRVAHFRPLFAAAHRPHPEGGPVTAAWDEWLPVADGAGLDPSDPRALLVRGSHLDRPWGSSSISLVALTRQGARYDFRATQGDTTWTSVLGPDE